MCPLVPWVPFCPLHLCLFPVPQVETTFPAHLGQSKKAGIAPGPPPIDDALAALLSEVHTTAQGELFQPESNPQSETSRKLTPGEIFNDFSLGILDTGKRKGPTLHHFF